MAESDNTADYLIRISGTLHERWAHWFDDAVITIEEPQGSPPFTTFHCPRMDQARLRGVVNKIWDLNLDLVSLQRLPPGRN